MKTMTFNVRINVLSDGENAWGNRVTKIADVIKQEAPMIIGMQEPNKFMIDDLAGEITNYKWVGEPRKNNDEYCPIFYEKDMVELLETETFWLSTDPDVPGSMSWNTAYPRICTWGEFVLKENRNSRFRVFNTHLDHVSEEARMKGIGLILDKINQVNKKEELPTILMGDFNADPNSDVVQFLENETSFVNVYTIMSNKETFRKTFHDFEGGYEGEPIDYIFVSSNIGLLHAEINRTVFHGLYPSDHYPLVTEISL